LAELEAKKYELVPKQQIDVTPYETELVNAKSKLVPFDQTEEYAQLKAKLDELENSRTEIPAVADTTELQNEKKTLLLDIEMLSQVIARLDEKARAEKRITEKQNELRANGIEKAKVEGLLDAVIRREREWADIVRTKSNQYLKRCHVEMLETAKSGEINDICTISIDGVDVNTTNTANKIIVGVDIAQAFMTKYDINLPIIIDNAEQITTENLPQHNGQLIAMYVDENYKDLNIG
jgi:hypothetical protein